MARNVFITFDYNDVWAKNLLVAQAKNDKFPITFYDYSVKEPFDNKWKTNCKAKIQLTSVTICLIGEETSESEAVVWELEESYRQGHIVFGVRIHSDKYHTIPKPLKDNDAKIYKWIVKDIAKYLDSL